MRNHQSIREHGSGVGWPKQLDSRKWGGLQRSCAIALVGWLASSARLVWTCGCGATEAVHLVGRLNLSA
jgi:hypothetical protein